jgi:hypothetical protein
MRVLYRIADFVARLLIIIPLLIAMMMYFVLALMVELFMSVLRERE